MAKVDATADNAKATAEDQGVQSYPTIKYFPQGSTTAAEYEGGRGEDDLVGFLNDKLGTHRAVGGGLDATAGTIETLDTIVGKFITGGTWASISSEVVEAARGLKDQYSQYYVKVLDKLAKNEGYAEKELARLQSLVNKGGLASEKVDDLISRSNILRGFVGRTGGQKEEL